jgi:hypothetical protein
MRACLASRTTEKGRLGPLAVRVIGAYLDHLQRMALSVGFELQEGSFEHGELFALDVFQHGLLHGNVNCSIIDILSSFNGFLKLPFFDQHACTERSRLCH